MTEATVQVLLPDMGESVTEGSIVEWRKHPGDWVAAGETLVEVTTDKVDVEVPAPAAGVVSKLLVDEGATVRIGTALAQIDTAAPKPDGAAATAPPPAAAASAPQPNGAPQAVAPQPVAPSDRVTPQARRVAERRGIDVSKISGSGPDGLVLRSDVEEALASGKAPALTARGASPAEPPPPRDAKLVPLKGPAAALAGYMEQSLAIPTATSFRTIPVGLLERKRRDLNAALAGAGRA
ncbi:MAG: E3 binding domain-containing protein, partial [Candidatus Eremiobacteraeota bacterium]|nr:E3 binding domain-containing protein [Candidatus Eremiobacteraeota bacterium]